MRMGCRSSVGRVRRWGGGGGGMVGEECLAEAIGGRRAPGGGGGQEWWLSKSAVCEGLVIRIWCFDIQRVVANLTTAGSWGSSRAEMVFLEKRFL